MMSHRYVVVRCNQKCAVKNFHHHLPDLDSLLISLLSQTCYRPKLLYGSKLHLGFGPNISVWVAIDLYLQYSKFLAFWIHPVEIARFPSIEMGVALRFSFLLSPPFCCCTMRYVSGRMKGREHHQGKGFVKPNFTCHVHPITNIQIFIIFLLHDVRIDFKDVDTCLTPPLKTWNAL